MRARRLVLLTFAIVSLAGLMISVTPRASAYEHVRNGSFESGADGWAAGYGASLSVAGTAEVTPIDGSASGKVTLGEGRFELRPAMSGTLAAGTYDFAAYVLAPQEQMSVRVQVQGAGFEESAVVTLDAGAWTEVRLEINAATTSNVSIMISGSGMPGDVLYFDAVQLSGAPPVTMTPTSVAPQAAVSPTVVVTAIASPTASPTPERVDTIEAHLRNASFEERGVDGAPLAWAKFGGALSGASDPVRSGSRAARLESSTESTKWLYQAVLVDGSATYGFDAWIWHNDANVAAAFLRISWYASSDGSGESIGSADSDTRLEAPEARYRHLTTGPATAPADARSARVRVLLAPASSAAAAIFIDDASFTPAAPLPLATPTPLEGHGASDDGDDGTSRTSRVSGVSRTSGATGGEPRNVPFEGASTVVINEVLYDPDLAGEDAAGEWVEIYNAGPGDVSLAGWALRDNVRTSTLPDIIVPAQDFAVVAASDGFFAAYPEFTGIVAWLGARIGNGLGNEGDRLELVAPNGGVVDAVSWGADASILKPAIEEVPAGHSIERGVAGTDSDTREDFVDNNMPSPGQAFEAGDGNSKRQGSRSTVEILRPSGDASLDWLPWALVALSGVTLAAAVAWRTVDAVRQRQRAT